ncbi:unnamed protein product [Paramecium primaurelia]|uniref:Uncharacterized protein n=2 Tax=Paramecium TaxID=5884 RepID=A0A8S1VZ69_9CILI|nr:unnamed protein product [Paramecium primaurelia]CAD8182101.1 unnamed protein product [Paramecium pentaurelia]
MDSNLYVKLSPQGTQKHKELESQCLMKFIYWVAVANISGALGGQLMMYIPMSSRQKQMRFRNGVFISTALLLSYHGYKLSKRDLRIGQKEIIQNKDNVLSPS